MLFLIVAVAAIVAFLVVKVLVKKQKKNDGLLLAEQPEIYTLLEKEQAPVIELEVEPVVDVVEVIAVEEQPKRKKTTTKKEGAAPKMSAKKRTNKQSK